MAMKLAKAPSDASVKKFVSDFTRLSGRRRTEVERRISERVRVFVAESDERAKSFTLDESVLNLRFTR